MASARFLRAGGLEAEVAGLAVEVGGPAAIASDAVSLLVRGGEVVAALAVSALAGLVEEAGRLRGVLRDTGSLRVDRGGVEAAEGVSALAAELRELPALRPVRRDAVAGEIERAQERTGARPVRLGVDVFGIGLSVARLLEDRGRAGRVLLDANAVAVGASDVHAAV